MSKKSILRKILAILARAAVRKYNPIIVGITGSVGKTSAKEAIFAVLKNKYRTRTSEKNYNNEIGLPLTILGIPHCGRNIFAWCFELVRTFFRGVLGQYQYPEILILEYGVDRPGDMDYLLSIARPNIAIVTAIGEIPAHVEFFKDPEELVKEKGKLVEALPSDGTAILNHDDYAVYDMNSVRKKSLQATEVAPIGAAFSSGMKEKTQAGIMTYGVEERSDFRIVNY